MRSINENLNATANRFVCDVKRNNRWIVLYGFGVVGRVTALPFLAEKGLLERLLFFIDGDSEKQGLSCSYGNRQFSVCAPRALYGVNKPYVILITASRYESIFRAIREDANLEAVPAYLLPYMLAQETNRGEAAEPSMLKEQKIPKIIHYCWFGGKPLPKRLCRYMETWEHFCPDYEILRWDEKNYDISRYAYAKQAYEKGKWAFVSDLARLDILYRYGGIYLDTDVELVRNLDPLLRQNGFCGVEKWRIINLGGGSGAIPGHPVLKEMLKSRMKMPFLYPDGSMNLDSSGVYESEAMMAYGFVPNNRTQRIKGMTVYASDYFHPYDYMTKTCYITANTYAIHHFAESWI